MKIIERVPSNVILPDSTTTFLGSVKEMTQNEAEEAAASAEAAQAVASLQVNTDMDQFGDLFSGVTSCSSEPNFTLIDNYTQ